VEKIVLDKFYEVARREGAFELKEFKNHGTIGGIKARKL